MKATKQAKSAAERKVMQRLSQTSAAWLLGYKHTRNLRDLTDVPVNDDGTYNGQDLLAYARGSHAIDDDVELPVEVIDELLSFCDEITFGRKSKRFLDILDNVVAQHGDQGALAVFRVLVAEVRQWFEWWPEDGRQPTESEIRQCHEESVQQQLAEIRSDPGPLRTIHTCDCGSVRRGGKWSKRNKVPKDWRTIGSVCDSCHDGRVN